MRDDEHILTISVMCICACLHPITSG
jgi:hypothetical protein